MVLGNARYKMPLSYFIDQAKGDDLDGQIKGILHLRYSQARS